MLVSFILGALIFGYAVFTLYRFVKRSKMGKCAGCSISDKCASACSGSSTKEQNISFSTKYSHVENNYLKTPSE
ncbi:FeoB-associated Cys-rich membrane protein [Peribacillus butanolivorans]|uniref:FeoB-associated Cys-rich membrane protein n=1 Tax=Peribacillus butanolivorans TaxID=421767 RepID=UPI0035D56FFC